MEIDDSSIKAIIGLGNPGENFYYHRHNIGFRVVDELAKKYEGNWVSKKNMQEADILIYGKKIILVKPETGMNASGKIIPELQKKGIKAENILVVHDELEKPFGALSFKFGGSHRGHNGLRSVIAFCGDFFRLRFGIGRPKVKDEVPHYVLESFSKDSVEIDELIEKAIKMIERLFEN